MQGFITFKIVAIFVIVAITGVLAGSEERHEFVVGSGLIKNFLLKQTGNLARGVAELVQNSRDSGATVIKITVTPETITVEDNGSGMDDGDIQEYFQKLGNSSKSGDTDKIGEFGVGRCQVFPHGVCTWETLDNILVVDLKDYLGFKKYKNTEIVNGTIAKVVLYAKMDFWKQTRVIDSIKHRFMFTDVDVYVNDKMLPKPDFTRAIKYGCITAIPSYDSRVFVKGMYVNNPENLDIKLIESADLHTNVLHLNVAREDIIAIDAESIAAKEIFSRDLLQINAKMLRGFDNKHNFQGDKLGLVLELVEANIVEPADLMTLRFVPVSGSDSKLSPSKIVKHYDGIVFDASDVELSPLYRDDVIAEYKTRTGHCVVELDQGSARELLERTGKVQVINLKTSDEYDTIVSILGFFKKQNVAVNIDEESETVKRVIRLIERTLKMICEDCTFDRVLEVQRTGRIEFDGMVLRFNINQINTRDSKHRLVATIYHEILKALAKDGASDLESIAKRYYDFASKTVETLAILMHDRME